MSLIHRKVYESLKTKPKLENHTILLQTAGGAPLIVDGRIDLRFEIGQETVVHPFYVVSDLNRNLILGKDWLVKHGVRLYFDLGQMRIGSKYIPLVEDIHIASVVRLAGKVVLKPQTATICRGKVKDRPYFTEGALMEVVAADTGFVGEEPGLMVSNSVLNMQPGRDIPVLVVNNTNKTYQLKRGCIVGTLEPVKGGNVVTLAEGMKNMEMDPVVDEDSIDVSEQHRQQISDLVSKNVDLFAASDMDLGCTQTVQMKIDVGDHPPVKLRPYRTPLTKRACVDSC